MMYVMCLALAVLTGRCLDAGYDLEGLACLAIAGVTVYAASENDRESERRIARACASVTSEPQSAFSLVREGRATYCTLDALAGSRRGEP